MARINPYSDKPERAFWRLSVGQRHYYDLEDVSRPVDFSLDDKVATAGSCFAQHIGRHLRNAGANYLDLEPCPGFISEKDAKRFGYGIYSCRYGNIYTVRQLLQLAQEALGLRTPKDIVWGKQGRYFDALRPSVDPAGHAVRDTVMNARRVHLVKVAEMLRTLDVFIFTLGLTETWMSQLDDTAYPTAAGTIAGSHKAEKYYFHNFTYPEIIQDLGEFWTLLRSINPAARMLLTVSPVPLAATATEDHVLVATTRSKSTLRAVAADFVDANDDVYYFPSFEIISAHPGRGMFFEPDLRNVNAAGVNLVMKHFFKSIGEERSVTEDADDVICDEEAIFKLMAQ